MGFEIIVLNSLMLYIIIKQRLIAKELIEFIKI
jgi:hypothetical protein